MGLENMLAKLGKNLKSVIQNIIEPQEMCKLARKVGFVQRCTGRLDGDEFVQMLIIESQDGEKNTLRGAIDTLGKIKSKAKMTIPGIRKRINSQAAANLIKGVFEKSFHIIMAQMNRVITRQKNEIGLLNFFPNVYLQDSSESQLDEALKNDYMGSGGGNGNGKGEASVKVDLIYEYKNKSLAALKITDRSQPDSVLGEDILKIIKKGDLVIRDLGYSVVRIFKQIETIGAFFLSRLHGSLYVYLNITDTQEVSLGSFLEKRVKKSGVVDVMVYISKQMFQCRLIAYRAPPDVQKERCKAYLKECKKRKRKPDNEYIKRLSFTIFITNVPVSIWSAWVVGTIYRLRWQVELIFKNWKSDLNFDSLAGTNVFRIQCLIYARLTAILMMFTVYSCIDKVALQMLEKEISIHKVIDWLKRNGRFLEIVMKGFSKGLWKSLIDDANYILCKENRRRRKTTRELINSATPFKFVTC
jgi:Transposase DDE domain